MNDTRKELARIARRLGRRLKMGRGWRNLSLAALAHKSGLALIMLEETERGVCGAMDADDLVEVARVLDFPLEFFEEG